MAEIDYGVGSEGYKRDWMSDVRELRGIRAYNTRTAQGALLATIESLKGLVRRWLSSRRETPAQR